MTQLLEIWDDDGKPDIEMTVKQRREGETAFTAVDITGQTIAVKLWKDGAVAREIAGTVVDGPAGLFKFARTAVTSPALAAGKYGVATKVGTGSDAQTFPSSEFLPTINIIAKGKPK